jgi:hypothetical protein
MNNEMGQYVRRQRETLGLTPAMLVRAMGYENINKGIRRLMELEGFGRRDEVFWLSICDQLSLDQQEILTAEKADDATYQAWLDEPIPMELAIRWIPGVYSSVALSEGVAGDPVKAEEFARKVARDKKRKVCLVLSRRKKLWVDEHGQ